MKHKPPLKNRPNRSWKRPGLGLIPNTRFRWITMLIISLALVIAGYFVVKIFAATSNPYDCNAPYPAISHGVNDNSGGRTDHCVSAVQWAFVNSTALYQYIGTNYNRSIAVDGRYDPDTPGCPSCNDYLWWPIVGLQNKLGHPQTGALNSSEVDFIGSNYGPYASTSPPPPPPPCRDKNTCNTSPPPPVAPDPQPNPEPPPPDSYTTSVDTFLPQLDDITLDQVSNTSQTAIQSLINNSNSLKTLQSGKAPRVFTGKLKLVPPYGMVTSGANHIRYYVDAQLKHTANNKPFTYSLDTTRLTNKRHILTIIAYRGSDKLDEQSYLLSIKNNLNFWQQLYNIISSPFGG